MRKTGTPVFPTAFVQEPKALETSHELSARGLFQTACDSCVGDKPEQSTTTQEKCDSREFAEACKPKACVPPQMGFAHLGLFAVK